MSDRVKKNPLRRWRIAAGYTLEEVSDLSGYSVSMLSRAERGERLFSPPARVRLARSLGVPIRELFDVELADELASASDG